MVREALTYDTLGRLEPREAAAYFITRRAEGLTASEESLLTAWLAADNDHRRAFDSADCAWHAFAEPDGDEILAAIRAHALSARPRTWTRWRPLAAAAAAALFVVTASAAVLSLPAWNPGARKPGAGFPTSVAPTSYASARGAVTEIKLPDGSTMTLDADSAAAARFGNDGRAVELIRGRAYFAVAPDRSRPFSVTAAGQRIIAVGTRFDVNLASEGLMVTLIEGHVTIGPVDLASKPITLEPGQQLVRHLDRLTIRTIGTNAENYSSWRIGLIGFDDESLANAVRVMNRYSSEQIVVRDPVIAAMRVSGQFRAGDAERFANTLAELHNLHSVRRKNEIELAPAR